MVIITQGYASLPGSYTRRGRHASIFAQTHHSHARSLVNRFGMLVFEDLKIINMSKAPEPRPDPEQEGNYLPNGASAKAGLNTSILDAGWGQFQQYCAAKAERAPPVEAEAPPLDHREHCDRHGAEHAAHILRKIGVSDRTQAAVWAVRKGLV